MADCEACREIEENYPEFANRGVTSGICTNLRENEGFKANDGKGDCYDLDLANDCLIGSMADEVKIADECNWKDFAEDFIKNLHTMLKAIICAICGLWAAVKSYRLTKDGDYIELTAFDGSHGRVKFTGTQYQIHTKTYEEPNITVKAGQTLVKDVAAPQPPEFEDKLYPMAVAGWTWEGEFASYLVTRYIQLVDRSGSPKVRVAVRNIATPDPEGTHDAHVTLMPEVMWWGRRTD